MLTLKLISEETERVIKGLEKKHFPNAREAVEKVLEYDKIRREAQQKLDTNKQQANQFAKQIGALMKEGKKEEAESAKAQVANLSGVKLFDLRSPFISIPLRLRSSFFEAWNVSPARVKRLLPQRSLSAL